MPPLFLIMGFGRTRRFWIPFSFFLLWPLIALPWILLSVINLFLLSKSSLYRICESARILLGSVWYLTGTKVDVKSSDGTNIYFLFI